MTMRLTIGEPIGATRQQVVFDYRFMSVPYQELDGSDTFSIASPPIPMPQGRHMLLKINPQRLAQSLQRLQTLP